jgi:CelD/BcsL family acetyltransferase involved in cellulose biosynthesis
MTARIEWLRDLAAIEALEPGWRALEASAAGRTLLATADFVLPWYRHYAHRARPLLGVAREGGTLVGLAPLVARPARIGGLPVRSIQFATSGAQSGEFLLAPGREAVAAAFLRALPAAVPFEVVRLPNLAAGSPLLAALERVAAEEGLSVDTSPTCHAVVDLSAGYEAYHAGLTGKFRANVRRRRKALEAIGPLAVEGVHFTADGAAREAALQRMFAVSDASWKARAGGPMAEHHRGFYRELARRFGARGALDLSILTVGGHDRAFMFGIAEHGVYYDVTLSFDDSLRHLAPGVLLTQEVLRRLAARGLHTLVSHGMHDYKRHFASTIVPRVDLQVFAPGPRARLGRVLRASLLPVWQRLGRRAAATVARADDSGA